MTFAVTFREIREYFPGQIDKKIIIAKLGRIGEDDDPISILTVLDSSGLDYALLCCLGITNHDKDLRLFAVWCARQVQNMMTDKRLLRALDVAARHAKGWAKDGGLAAAQSAAWRALDSIDSPRDSIEWESARHAALSAVYSASKNIRRDVRDVAWEAAHAVIDRECIAKREAKQEARFRQMLTDGAFIGSTQPEAEIAHD